jgi:uncharacterized membrane protein
LSPLHYLPLTLPFFALLAGLYLTVVVLIQIGLLRYAYRRIGIGPGAVLLLLFGSLVGSYYNIPVAHLSGHQSLAHREISFFGMRYVIPVVVDWPGTVIAVNVGGALIPGAMSLYLLIRNDLWVPGAIATACVTAVCHQLAHPIQGLGIALPVFVPSLAAGFVGIALSPRHGAALAYISGALGVLIGADLLNLGAIGRMGAPVASIGGAGTFDGIFLTGLLAVLIASFSGDGAPGSPGGWPPARGAR